MNWREFEERILDRIKYHAKKGELDGNKYGVQAVTRMEGGELRHDLIRSLPDFEGVIPGPLPFTFDAKVCSAASFGLNDYLVLPSKKPGKKRRQLDHMLRRSRYGVICFFLIHWSSRELKTKSFGEVTYAFPIADSMFWNEVMYGERRSINREDCEKHGVKVVWNTLGQERTFRPDILSALQELKGLSHGESQA